MAVVHGASAPWASDGMRRSSGPVVQTNPETALQEEKLHKLTLEKFLQPFFASKLSEQEQTIKHKNIDTL